MKNELTIKQESLLTVMEDKGLSEIIKPLVNEIHLFDTFVAGTSYLEDDTALKEVKINDKLNLKREQNKYDERAIKVEDNLGRKLGYVPEKDNVVFSKLMDAGKLLVAKVNDIKDLQFMVKISISIYLVDY